MIAERVKSQNYGAGGSDLGFISLLANGVKVEENLHGVLCFQFHDPTTHHTHHECLFRVCECGLV